MFQFSFRGLRTVTFVFLKLPEQVYSPCCRSADSSLPTLSLRTLRTMLKHYNNKALEGRSIQLREKCEEWNPETNNCPVGLCSLLVPPEAQGLPQQGSLHGKSSLWDCKLASCRLDFHFSRGHFALLQSIRVVINCTLQGLCAAKPLKSGPSLNENQV